MEAFLVTLKSMEERAASKAAKQDRDNLLLKLIYGQNCDTENFYKSMQAASLFITAQCYRVVIITAQEELDINFNKIELYIDVQKRNDYEIYLLDLHSGDAVVMLVGMSEAADLGLKNELALMAETLEDSLDGHLRFYIGEKATKLSEIHRSYAQACTCMHMLGESEETIRFYGSLDNEKKLISIPKRSLEDYMMR